MDDNKLSQAAIDNFSDVVKALASVGVGAEPKKSLCTLCKEIETVNEIAGQRVCARCQWEMWPSGEGVEEGDNG